MPSHPSEILAYAQRLIEDRGASYGGVEQSFERAAAIATLSLDRDLHAYEVMVVMRSVKQARNATNPGHMDSQLDAVNYQAFAATVADDYAMWRDMRRQAREADNERTANEAILRHSRQSAMAKSFDGLRSDSGTGQYASDLPGPIPAEVDPAK